MLLQGQCIPQLAPPGFTCKCARGYVGNHCQTKFDHCKPNPCMSGGICKVSDTLNLI